MKKLLIAVVLLVSLTTAVRAESAQSVAHRKARIAATRLIRGHVGGSLGGADSKEWVGGRRHKLRCASAAIRGNARSWPKPCTRVATDTTTPAGCIVSRGERR